MVMLSACTTMRITITSNSAAKMASASLTYKRLAFRLARSRPAF